MGQTISLSCCQADGMAAPFQPTGSRSILPSSTCDFCVGSPEMFQPSIAEKHSAIADALRSIGTRSPTQSATDYPDFVGLPNRSCDCFWNCVVQSLRHTPGLQRRISEFAESQPANAGHSEPPLAHALADLLQCMDAYVASGRRVPGSAPQKAAFVAAAASRIIGDDGLHLLESDARRQHQQDAYEFYRLLAGELAKPASNRLIPDAALPTATSRFSILGDASGSASLEKTPPPPPPPAPAAADLAELGGLALPMRGEWLLRSRCAQCGDCAPEPRPQPFYAIELSVSVSRRDPNTQHCHTATAMLPLPLPLPLQLLPEISCCDVAVVKHTQRLLR